MKRALFGAAVLCWPAAVLAQGGSAEQPFKALTRGVIVDVSVLGRDGEPVTDLRPQEFEIIEQGQQQKILAVAFVRSAGDTTASPEMDHDTPAADTEVVDSRAMTKVRTQISRIPSVSAILFDRLSPEARAPAYRAAIAFLASLNPRADYAGVFLADVDFRIMQSFTTDIEALREGLTRAMSAPAAGRSDPAESPGRLQAYDPRQAPTASAESARGFSLAERMALLSPSGAADPDKLLLRLELRMQEGYSHLASEYEGRTSLAGLRAVVDALRSVNGRKRILYFSEGLQIPSRWKARFEALTRRANTFNISIYPVDAAGLRVHSMEAQTARSIGIAGAQGVGDERRGDGAWTKELENQAQLLSSRPSAALGRLAKETGGFVVENTNDLTAGVERMRQERSGYYLIGYQPADAPDSSVFRKVTVRVKRPGVKVRARAGYAGGLQ